MGKEFTKHQSEAIDWRKQDACVVAGPGSGKTTVLVERYRTLVSNYQFKPHEILAITFTEKAAANMKAKVAEQFQHDPAMLRELESAWISTIHGFCSRLLRDNAIAAGIDPRFTLLDARESEGLQYECLNAALDEFVELRRADAVALIPALHVPELSSDLIGVFDAMRSAGKTIAEVRAMPSPTPQATPLERANELRGLLANWSGRVTPLQAAHHGEMLEWARLLEEHDAAPAQQVATLVASIKINMNRIPPDHRPGLKAFREVIMTWAVDRYSAPFRAMIFDILARFDQLYSQRKTSAGALDFNDLERRAIHLLQVSSDVRDRVRSQFRQIMLDEFQDINQQQWTLIELVRGEDVFFAVGDVNQSIYGFRHARPDIFHQYEGTVREAGKHSVSLLHNFRSRPEILRCVELLLNERQGIESRALIARDTFEPRSHPSIEVLRVETGEDEAGVREARWIAHRILALNRQFRDYAVLCRNSDSMRPILEVFTQAGIPFVCGRRQSFLLSREGMDITALLHTVANPRDAIALATVLRSAFAGVSDQALLRLRLMTGSLTGGLNAVAFDSAKLAGFEAEDARKLERFCGNLKRWRAEQPVLPLDVLLSRALSDCGRGLNDNIESFLHLARTRGDGRSLVRFLQEIDSIQKALNTESDLSDEDQGNCVQVMTAHSAKGLEFPVTIIASMHKGTRPMSASVTFTPAFGLGLKWHDAGSKKGVEDSWQLRNTQELEGREKEEANRLLYVAMTRAEDHLILSYSLKKRKAEHWAKLLEALLEAPRDFDISVPVTDEDPPLPTAADRDAGTAVTLVPLPVVADQYDSAVNVTSLAVFANCPRKYYLGRYIGWSGGRFRHFDPEDLPDDTPEQNTPAAKLGSFVHEILAGKTGQYPPEAHELAVVFESSELGRRAAASTRSAREWDFIADIGGTLVRGSIDLWFEDEAGVHIVDYKTDAKVHAAEYETQLALYAYALERALGRRPASAHLHYLRYDRVIEIPVDDTAISNAIGLIATLRTAQDRLQFPLNVSEHCRACPFYRGLCPATILNP